MLLNNGITPAVYIYVSSREGLNLVLWFLLTPPMKYKQQLIEVEMNIG